jgi:hypothetical protein
MKSRLLTVISTVILSTILIGCGSALVPPTPIPTTVRTEEPPEAPTPTQEVPEGVRTARDAAMAQVRRIYGEETPSADLDWTEEQTTQEGLVGSSSFRYTAGDWVMDINTPVAAPENLIYQVMLSNTSTGFQWQGEVDAAGEVTEPPAPDDGKPIAGWYGRVIRTPGGAQYDDYLMLLPEGTGEVGIEGADAAIQAEIESLRDGDMSAHVWGTLMRDVPDHGGYQLRVDWLRPEGPGPLITSAVEGWEGIVASTPQGAQFDDTLQIAGEFPVRYGIESTDAEIARQMETVRDTLTPVQVWGTLTCGVPDVNGCQLDVTRLLLVGEPVAPTPTPEPQSSESTGEPVDGWAGTIVDLPPGNQFGQLFERGDGEQFGIGTPKDTVREQVNEASSTGAWIKVWGTLYTGVPAAEARTIEIEQIEFLSQPEEQGKPVEGWIGSVHKLPPGNQFGQYFVRDDGERFGIGTTDEAMRQQINAAAWTGAQVQVWGRLYTGVPATEARHIGVERIETISDTGTESRNLSPFAEVSASSQLPSDQYGTYFPYAAIDSLKETAWVEGASGSGVGEWIQLNFAGMVEVWQIALDVGFDKNADLFAKNNRIKQATFIFSNGEQVTLDFDDARGLQTFVLARAPGPSIQTTSVRMIIEAVYPGTRYDDTCLAEIEIWGVTR